MKRILTSSAVLAVLAAAPAVAQRKATIELGMLRQLQSVEAKADQLNEYDFFWGEPNSFKRDLDRFRNATVEAVTRGMSAR